MNSQLIHQLASQRISEIYEQATIRQLPAADREPRESVKDRVGWALIKVGLKLTGPPNPHAGPRPADL